MLKQKPLSKKEFRQIRIIYAFLGVFFFMGVLFTYMGLHEYIRSTYQNSKTQGTVESYQTSSLYNGKGPVRYVNFALVRFEASGQAITFKGEGHESFLYTIGQQIDVTYEAENPYNAHISSEQYLSSLVLMGVPLMLFFGFFIFVVHRFVSKIPKTLKSNN